MPLQLHVHTAEVKLTKNTTKSYEQAQTSL